MYAAIKVSFKIYYFVALEGSIGAISKLAIEFSTLFVWPFNRNSDRSLNADVLQLKFIFSSQTSDGKLKSQNQNVLHHPINRKHPTLLFFLLYWITFFELDKLKFKQKKKTREKFIDLLIKWIFMYMKESIFLCCYFFVFSFILCKSTTLVAFRYLFYFNMERRNIQEGGDLILLSF